MGWRRCEGCAAAGLLLLGAGCLAAPPSAVDAGGEADAIAELTIVRDPELEIPDTGPEVEDSAEVEAQCGVDDVTVDIYITHPYRGDLIVTLSGPAGQSALLKSFEGDDGDDDLVGNYPRTLVPEESLDLFAGGDAQGTWTLLVRDAGERDVGILRSWSLNLSCR